MRLSIDIPDDLHREVKIKAINNGTTVTAVVKRLLEEYVSGNTISVPKAVLIETSIVKDAPFGPFVVQTPPPLTPPNFVRPISKEDQAKGRSRK